MPDTETIRLNLRVARLNSQLRQLVLHVEELAIQRVIICGLLRQNVLPLALALLERVLEAPGLLGGLVTDLLQPVIEAFQQA